MVRLRSKRLLWFVGIWLASLLFLSAIRLMISGEGVKHALKGSEPTNLLFDRANALRCLEDAYLHRRAQMSWSGCSMDRQRTDEPT